MHSGKDTDTHRSIGWLSPIIVVNGSCKMSSHVLMTCFSSVTWEKKPGSISPICSMRLYRVTPVPLMISTRLLPIFHHLWKCRGEGGVEWLGGPFWTQSGRLCGPRGRVGQPFLRPVEKTIYLTPYLCYHFINQYTANM